MFLRFIHICSGASQVVQSVKNHPANAKDTGDVNLISGLGRSPGGGHGNLLKYFCVENPVDREASQAQSIESQRVGQDRSN